MSFLKKLLTAIFYEEDDRRIVEEVKNEPRWDKYRKRTPKNS